MSKPGTLHFLIGKMGAGKSSYSTNFAAQTDAILISEDEWLGKLYPGEIINFDDFIVRHRKLLDVLGSHLQQLLTAGASVILDFPANTIKDRQWYLRIAEAAKAPHRAIYLDISNETCLEHVAKRRIEQPERAQFDTPDMFATVTQYFEEPTESEGLTLHVVTA